MKISFITIFLQVTALVLVPGLSFAQPAGNGVIVELGVDGTSIPPVEPPDSEGGGGGGHSQVSLQIVNVITDVGARQAEIEWQTTTEALSKISWGKTAETYDGVISETMRSKEHKVTLDLLEPGTRYYVLIESEDRFGMKAEKIIIINTLSLPDYEAPSNPSKFGARITEDGVELSWQNPEEEDFAGVRLVRSDIFYPQDIYDGKTLYEGMDELVIDREVLSFPGVYYYSVFSYDHNGNHSSGAITAIRVAEDGSISVGSPDDIITDAPDYPGRPALEGLSIEDFLFVQNGKAVASLGGRIAFSSEGLVLISLPYEKLPEVLKTVMVTLSPEGSGEKFSFLLKINKDKTAYEAVMDPRHLEGSYDVSIVVLDYKNQAIKRLSVGAVVLGLADGAGDGSDGATSMSDGLALVTLVVIGLMLLALASRFFEMRRRKKEGAQFVTPSS